LCSAILSKQDQSTDSPVNEGEGWRQAGVRAQALINEPSPYLLHSRARIASIISVQGMRSTEFGRVSPDRKVREKAGRNSNSM
jgi:hypothetical protein